MVACNPHHPPLARSKISPTVVQQGVSTNASTHFSSISRNNAWSPKRDLTSPCVYPACQNPSVSMPYAYQCRMPITHHMISFLLLQLVVEAQSPGRTGESPWQPCAPWRKGGQMGRCARAAWDSAGPSWARAPWAWTWGWAWDSAWGTAQGSPATWPSSRTWMVPTNAWVVRSCPRCQSPGLPLLLPPSGCLRRSCCCPCRWLRCPRRSSCHLKTSC